MWKKTIGFAAEKANEDRQSRYSSVSKLLAGKAKLKGALQSEYGGASTRKSGVTNVSEFLGGGGAKNATSSLDYDPGYKMVDPQLQHDKAQSRKYFKNSERLNNTTLERVIGQIS